VKRPAKTRPLVFQRARPATRGVRPQAPRRYEPLWADPERRDAQRARRAELVERAEQVCRRQRELACELAEIRTELAESRALMWPRLDRHLVRGFRHTFDRGPAPIPPAAPNAIPLRGAQLRYAALAVLLDAGEPLTLTEIHRALLLRGYRLAGRQPVQQLADALGYEHDCGRARRVERGTYTVNQLSPAARRLADEPMSVRPRSQLVVDWPVDEPPAGPSPAAEEDWRPLPP
jgi:hypothetical protein